MFDNTTFYIFREKLNKIELDLEKAEEENWDERKLVNRLNRRVNEIQKQWREFEESWEEDQPDHNLEIFEQYKGTLDGDRVHWNSERDILDHVNEDESEYFARSGNQFIRIEIRYLEETDNYRFELEDDLYDLEIYSTKDDTQGILAVLYDLASKFDFEDIVGLDKANEDEVEFDLDFN